MAKYAELPDGTRLEFPDDTQDSVIDSVVKKHLGISETAGIVEAAKGAGKRGLASAKTAITAPFVGGEEAGIAGLEAQKAIEERPGFSWDEIKRKYEQEGLLSAAGEAASQVPGTIAEQAPTLGAIMAGGRLGAMGGAALGGAPGAVIGGIGGAALYPFLTQSGSNIERQVQEQQTAGEPVDVNLAKAYGAGAGQTALEMTLGPEALLARGIGKQTAEEIAKKLAAETTLKSVAKGVGKTVAEEVPTEIAQQVLERAQAGLPISPSDEQALQEYLASGAGAALAGPMGGPMRLMQRSAAKEQIAKQESDTAEKEAEQKRIEDIGSQSGGQATIPGFEPVAPSKQAEEELPKEITPETAADYLRSLPTKFVNPSQIKEALKDTEFEGVGPKKVLDAYKIQPHQTSLFDEEGGLTPEVLAGYESRQKDIEAMQKRADQTALNETVDLFGAPSSKTKAEYKKLQEEQNMRLFGTPTAPEELTQLKPGEQPSQGGSANLQMQKLMREAEQQTAIDKANRERQGLFATPEGLLMNQQAAENRAKAIEESAPFQQRALDLQQAQQQALLEAQQQKAAAAMAKKLEAAKVGQNLDIFGAASIPRNTQEIIETEQPSQGGSANLQMQKLMREAEQQTAIDKANRERQGLFATPEGQLLTPRQQQERIEAEPFKQAAEQKAADLKAAKEEGRLPETAITKETLTTLHPDLAKTAIGKRVASEPAKYSMNNTEGLNDVVKSLEVISTKKPDLAPSINPFLTNLKKHVEVLTGKKTEQTQEVGTQPTADKLQLPEAFAKPLSDQATQHVTNNDFSGLLNSIAEKHENKDVKKILNKISALGLDTKIQTGDVTGAGEYDPNTNTITFNPNTGLNEHTAIHEPVHAAIAHVLDNKAHPLTKAFDNLFQQVKSKLGNQYGGTNLQEFASEAVSNPEFQALLKNTKANNGGNLFQRMVDAVARFFGFRKEQTAYNRALKHINDIIDVSHEVPRTGGEKLAHVTNDADLKAATQIYAVPQNATPIDLKQKFENVKADVTKGSLGEKLTELRMNVAHSGATIQKFYQNKLDGAVKDALTGEISGHVLFDQAQDASHISAATIHQGVPVFENGIPKVKQSNNTIENAMRLLKEFGDRIGSQNDADHATQAYMLAQNYERVLKNNARIEKQIEDLKATGKAADKAKVKDLKARIAHVSPEQAAAIKPGLEYGNRHPEIKKIANMWEAIKNADIDFQEQSGMISKELADKYRNDPGYVPMYRVMDDMEKANPGSREYYKGLADVKAEKHFTGSDKDVKNIFENMLNRHIWAVESAIRNNANRRLSQDLGVVGDDGKTKYYSTQPVGKKDTTAPVWIEGKRRWVEYSDPSFAIAIKGLEPLTDPFIKSLGKVSRILRTSVTAMPTFQLVQIMKDAPRAALLSGVNHPFELMGRVLKDAFVLYSDMIAGRENAVIKEMERAGISGGYGHTVEEINDRLRRQLGIDANTKVKQALDMVEKIAAISDAAQRKAIYEQTLKETGDKDLAEDRARNIINWKRHGANGRVRVLSQVIPFMNAYIQSMDVLLSAMTGTGISGKEKAAARTLFYSTAVQLMVVSGAYAMMIAGDEEYDKMDDKEKLNNLVIPGTGIKIPVASEIGLLIKMLPELSYQYITREGTTNPMDAAKLRSTIANQFADAVLSPNVMPQAAKPLIEITTNHNFLTDTPIIGHGLERKATSEQFTESTSELAKLIGQTNVVSPMLVDHFIKGYSGTMGSLTLTLLDSIVNQFSDVKRPSDATYKNPLISQFVVNPHYKDRVNGYYDLLKESDKIALKLNDLKKAGKFEEAREFREENKQMIGVRQQVQNLSNRLEKIREQHKRIYNSNLSADDKRQKLEELEQRKGEILKNINILRVKAGL